MSNPGRDTWIGRWRRLTAVAGLLCGTAAPGLAAPPRFEVEVAAVLRTYCAGCHNDADREGDFSVETFASLRQGGDKGDPIRPGAPDDSLLIKLIEGRAKPAMPPKDEPPVPPAELAVLKAWIADGAKGPASDVSLLRTLGLPPLAIEGSGRGPVSTAALSPEGDTLAVASAGRVELRNPTGRRLRKTLEGMPGKVNAVHFSSDGRRLLTAGGVAGLDGVAQVWDLASGRRLAEFGGHRDAVQDAEWSPDGRWLATGGYDRAVRLWRVEDGALVWSNSVHNGAVFDVAFDPSSLVLATASADQTVKLWRVRDGVRLDTLNQPQGELYRVEFTPDGTHVVATGADRRIHLWRFTTRENPGLNPVVASQFAHDMAIDAMALSRDGRLLATAAADRTVKLWTMPGLKPVRAWEPQAQAIAALVAGTRPDRFTGIEAGAGRGVKRFESGRVREKAETVAGVKGVRTEGIVAHGEEPGALAEVDEREANDLPKSAQDVPFPVTVRGAIGRPGDADLYRFRARAGEPLTLEIRAARDGSRLDSRVEVLTEEGRPVEQVVLQAVRDSWFTFRGKDSETIDDFRLHNWAEMDLDEHLYAGGEVVKLWLYPRGPDSGFKVYPGEGRRHAMFGTTPVSHALNEPAYVVRALPPGTQPAPNGLPVFRLNFENDDDPTRQSGADSLLLFHAPTTGRYVARVTDTRGFGGSGTNFQYRLGIRPRRPAFSVRIEGMNPKVSPGSGREIRFVATRKEGFEGPIRVEVGNLPKGFRLGGPVEIEAGQVRAVGVLSADTGAASPDAAADGAVTVTARAEIGGREVAQSLGTLGDIQVDKSARVTVEILPGPDRAVVKEGADGLMEFVIRPGQTIQARVRAVRHDFKERIELGGDDSGRNLPHGVYVDNIGLNGLLIVEGQTEREFFLTAARKVKPGVRLFHLRATADGGQCSRPVRLRVVE